MSGEIHNTRTQVAVTNNTLTLDNFRELTTGRNVNRGTLKLVKDKTTGTITGLRCSKHHIWRTVHNPKVKEADALALKSALKDVLDTELKKIFNKDEFKNLPQSRLDALKAKQDAILNAFEKRMTIKNEDYETKKEIMNGVQRSTIKRIIDCMDILGGLTTDELCEYDTKALLRLMNKKTLNHILDEEDITKLSDDKRKVDTARAQRTTAYKGAYFAMMDAPFDDLKKAGNTLIRACYKNLAGGREAFNDALLSNNVTTIYLDENGDLAFDPNAYDAEIRNDFEKLIGAVALKKDAQKLNKDLGGDLTKEAINDALNAFAQELKDTIDKIAKEDRDKAKSEIPALTMGIGSSLAKVTNPQVLLKAATALLFKGDFLLAGLAKMRPGTAKYNAELQSRLDTIASIFKREKSSLELEFNEADRVFTGALKLKADADIAKIQKDIGRLLAALTRQEVVVNDATIDQKSTSTMSNLFSYGTFDTKNRGVRVPQALQEFREILDNADQEPMPDAMKTVARLGVKYMNDTAKTEIPKLMRDMDETLEKVNDRAVLLKAANILLQKGDFGLVRLASKPQDENFGNEQRTCRNRIAAAFKADNSSLEFTDANVLALKEDADIETVRKDVKKLLNALTDDAKYDRREAKAWTTLRNNLTYATAVESYGQGHVPQALRAFREVLASAIDGDEGFNLLSKEESEKAEKPEATMPKSGDIADKTAKREMPGLMKTLGETLGKVNDRAVLLNAASVLLNKGDRGLAPLSNMPRDQKYSDAMRVCRNRIAAALEKTNFSLRFTGPGLLIPKTGTDITTIKKDIAKLLSALTDCDVEGIPVDDKKALRKAFGYETTDGIYGQGHVPQALRAFGEVLASAIDGDEGFNLLSKNENGGDDGYNPIPMNED